MLLSSIITVLCLVQLPGWATAYHKHHSKSSKISKRSDSPPSAVFAPSTMGDLTLGSQYSGVALTCEAMTRPVPSIHWLKDGKVIKKNCASGGYNTDDSVEEGDELRSSDEWLGLSSTRSTLFIDCLDPSDAANYTCVAETPVSRDTTSTMLRVETAQQPSLRTLMGCATKGEPARIYMSTRSRLEYAGNSVQLLCRAQGHPQPQITWYDRDNNVIEDGGNYKITQHGDLVIKSISWEDHMGVFRCEASNEFGADVAEPFLYPTGRGDGPLPF